MAIRDYIETDWTNITIPSMAEGVTFGEQPDIKACIYVDDNSWQIVEFYTPGYPSSAGVATIDRKHPAFNAIETLFCLYCYEAIEDALDEAGVE